MSLETVCPNLVCARRYTTSEAAVGRSAQCRVCGQTFIVGGSTTTDGIAFPTRTALPPKSGSYPELRTVGRFLVRGKLGAGAFGTVYRAYDPNLNREVALKVPHSGAVDTPKRVERFLREAKAAAGLRHPHIVPVFDAGQDGDRYYIASAFIDGKPLSDTIDESGTDFARAARVVRELAEALAYAHSQGIVHRDVKPQNIMVDSGGHIHLMDFGLAARHDEEAKLTADGAVMGTPAYMAPEQASGQQGEARPAADQYAAGVVLYELLTGAVPFAGPLPVVLHQVMHTDPDPPRKLRPYVPKDLETICLKAMAKRPEHRYADCQELADDLRRWLEGEPIQARRLGSVERVIRWCRREPVLAMIASLAVVCLIGVAVVSSISAALLASSADREGKARQEAEQGRRDAEEQKLHADAAQQDAAEQARASAEAKHEAELARMAEAGARQIAEQARQAEAEARIKEVAQRKETERALRKAEASLYVNYIAAADREWWASNVAKAEQSLDQCKPDLRQWEWYYLKQLCQSGGRVLRGHTGKVWTVLFSPDGKRLASCGEHGEVRIWETVSGKQVSRFKIDATCLAFSPDSKRVVTAGGNGGVIIWDATTGQELLVLARKQDRDRFSAIAYSPDGKHIAGVGNGGGPWVWDAGTGAVLVNLGLINGDTHRGHAWDVTGVAFSPDGRRLATASYDQTVRIWDWRAAKEVLIIDPRTRIRLIQGGGRPYTCWSVAFSPDGTRILATCADKTVRMWEATTGREVFSVTGHLGDSTCVAVTKDGRFFASASEDQTVKVWDMKTGRELSTRRGHTGWVNSVAFSPDGSSMASAGFDGTVRVWDASPTTVQECLVLNGHDDRVSYVALSPEGKKVVSIGGAKTIAWNTDTGQELAHWPASRATFSPNGHYLALTRREGAVLIDIARSKETVLGGMVPSSFAFSLDSQRLAARHTGNSVTIWDTSTLKERSTFSVSVTSESDNSLVFDGDGKHLLVRGRDSIHILNAATGQVVRTAECKQGSITSLALSSDGTRIASAGTDGTIKIWDVASTRELLTLRGHLGPVNSVAFAPRGNRLASAGDDKMIKVWDTETGQEVLTLRGHFREVNCVVFSTDGRRLASASGDHSVRIWKADLICEP